MMGRAPTLEPLPSYGAICFAFYGGAPAPGAPMVPTPLRILRFSHKIVKTVKNDFFLVDTALIQYWQELLPMHLD